MVQISLKEKDFIEEDISRYTKKIMSSFEKSKSQIRFISHVLNAVSNSDQILNDMKPTYLEQLVETELKINPQNKTSIERFKKEYEACFLYFTKKNADNYYINTNKVRGTVLELIVEKILGEQFKHPDYYKMGCQVLVDGQIISLTDIGIEGAPSTIDFAGVSTNSIEGYECKTTPNAFGNSPEHVHFLYYLVNKLLDYSVDAKIGCLVFEGKRAFEKRMKKMYSADFPDLVEKLNFVTVGEMLKSSECLSE